MDLNPELLQSEKKSKRRNYESKYFHTYYYWNVYSSSYCLFAYEIYKNG